MMELPSKENAVQLLKNAQETFGTPTKKYFVLEDDTYTLRGYTYIGNQADTLEELLIKYAEVDAWTYAIYVRETLRLAAFGTCYG